MSLGILGLLFVNQTCYVSTNSLLFLAVGLRWYSHFDIDKNFVHMWHL